MSSEAAEAVLGHGGSPVRLGFKGLGTEGFEDVVGALGSEAGAGVTALDLSCNSLGPVGCVALAPVLASHASLTALDLSANPLGDGVEAIASCLGGNTTLESLDLHAGCVTDAGAAALAHMLTTNSTLKNLNLRANYLTDACLEAVSAAIAANRTLTIVNLHSNEFSDAGFRRLQELLAGHPSVADSGAPGPGLESLCSVS